MIFKVARPGLICLLALFFLLAQTLAVVAAYAQAQCPAKAVEQKISQSKRCCCCGTSSCPCDLKKDDSGVPMNHDNAFVANMGHKNLQETSSFRESDKEIYSDELNLRDLWFFARAPCPIIYLTTLSILC